MSSFGRIMAVVLLASLVVLPYLAGARGWGLGSEKNPKVAAGTTTERDACPSALRDPISGRCRRTHRSHYSGRTIMGGGLHGGK